jgi:1-acyl-sn-glycerol-3-phosphate acyltransferase
VAYVVIRSVLGLLFRVLWRPQIEGVHHVPAEGAVIVASNHLSFIDSIVIPLSVPHRRVTFLAKAEYFTGGGLLGLPRRAFFRGMGAVPIERGERRDAQVALDTALTVLRRGWAFGVYPEGTRSRDGRLYRGRTGIGWLALQAGVPVVPVGLSGTDRVQPVGARVPRVRRVRVRFGEPVLPSAYADDPTPARARRRLTDDVMDRIAALSEQERCADYNALPADH